MPTLPIRTSAGLLRISTPPAAQGGGTPGVLAASDFTFLGYYTLKDSALHGATFGNGLTHRYVGGQLRLMTIGLSGVYYVGEFALPGGGFGQDIATGLPANWYWGGNGPSDGDNPRQHHGIWWEDQGGGTGRLWSVSSLDYPDTTDPGSDSGIYETSSVCVRTLNSDGTVSNFLGPYGFDGVGQRAFYGGVQAIPAWFRTAYGTGPYAFGWGGYSSKMGQGYTPSMGPFLLAGPDVTTYPNPTGAIPAADFKIACDFRSGAAAASDWYGSGTPSSFDRGARNSDVINYYDGGDPRTNPPDEPTDPPGPAAQWLSPAPDGLGRWVWGDSYYSTGCWIEGPTKRGFVAILTGSQGKAFYAGSNLHSDARLAELQVFDPAHFGEVILGTRHPWAVQPVASKLLTGDLAPLGLLYSYGAVVTQGAIGGATFDATTKTLWVLGNSVSGGFDNILAAYSVNC